MLPDHGPIEVFLFSPSDILINTYILPIDLASLIYCSIIITLFSFGFQSIHFENA